MLYNLYRIGKITKMLGKNQQVNHNDINDEWMTIPNYILAKSFEEAFEEIKKMNIKYITITEIKELITAVRLDHHKIFADKLEEALKQPNICLGED